ncbi:AI-2E family transporter [Rubrivirga sp.]|uniref:AI-2E family transporter n=1 Tax=Rubrivirga sp. TaxID=1885344 RepID=UPI003B517768
MTPEHHTPLDTPEAFRQRARYVVALVVVAVVGLFVLWTTRQVLLLVFLGAAIGVLFFHTSRWLAEHTGVPRGATLAAVVLTVLGVLGAAAVFGGPRLADEATALAERAPELLELARNRLGLPESALTLPEALGTVGGQLLGWFSTAAGVVSGVLVVLIVAVYTAAAPSQYTAAVTRLFDHEHQAFVRDVLAEMGSTLLAWLRGVGIAVALLGTMAAVGLSLIGVPGALALAAFAAALTVIPTFGPFIGWAPAVVVGFAEGTTMGLWTLGLAITAQQIEGSVITPKVQGSMVRVGPAFIVAGQIVLGSLAGFLGILLVVPVLGVGLILIQRLYIGPFVKGEPADPENPPRVSSPDGEVVRADHPAGSALTGRR